MRDDFSQDIWIEFNMLKQGVSIEDLQNVQRIPQRYAGMNPEKHNSIWKSFASFVPENKKHDANFPYYLEPEITVKEKGAEKKILRDKAKAIVKASSAYLQTPPKEPQPISLVPQKRGRGRPKKVLGDITNRET
jgi:hypothetical protein